MLTTLSALSLNTVFMNRSSGREMFELLVEREDEKVQLIVGGGNPVALQLKLKPLGTMTVSCALLAVPIEGNSEGKNTRERISTSVPKQSAVLKQGKVLFLLFELNGMNVMYKRVCELCA